MPDHLNANAARSLTSNLFGLMAMLSGGGIGTPSTAAVRQLRAGINSSAAVVEATQAEGRVLLV